MHVGSWYLHRSEQGNFKEARSSQVSCNGFRITEDQVGESATVGPRWYVGTDLVGLAPNCIHSMHTNMKPKPNPSRTAHAHFIVNFNKLHARFRSPASHVYNMKFISIFFSVRIKNMYICLPYKMRYACKHVIASLFKNLHGHIRFLNMECNNSSF